ncbi:MAG: ABC transporter ATP-binding protein [Spirochaetaceae bacterium]|jgi:ATP-binding cassette subfamily B protein|uniref:ABC transporter ATP-binding protein n=1 Tax=Sphaerochaeta halotolerans TaxID=2293840 RepID=A0A372MGB7_9SPIR|nr:ABC transporter ATP-binding protein [Sphaerochaeta halotolerans]MBG0767803.1 ABC transporter ATP-binding protein [Spirochaetaceae bacterium]MDN5334505.1 ATP-binding cassette, subfamily bacterial [Sphaerochaeta sp.]RFU94784.1 ABC transporter ATP-binding protein [Sphaerochaeta halotolerans]
MLKRFIAYYRPYKGLFFLDMGVAIFASILSILFPTLTRQLLRVEIPDQNLKNMIIIFGLMLLIYILQAICQYIRVTWGHILGVKMETDMRSELFGHLQKLSFGFFDKTKTGHMMSRITNDLFQITEMAHHAPEDLIISVATILGSYILMFSYSVPLALISLIPLPIMVFYGVYYGIRMKATFRRVRRTVADVNSNVENSLMGIREVKSYGRESYQEAKFNHVNDILRDSKMEQYRVMGRYHSILGFFRELYYFCTIAGGTLLIFMGKVQSYDLVTFILYVGVVLPPIDRLINFTEQLQQGMASFERFTQVMDEHPDIQDVKDAKSLKVKDGTVQFDHVSFSYENSAEVILKDVDITIPGGSTYALVGESGAGKSTFASLIPRFYEPSEGKVCIDGQDIRELTQHSLRQNIGFVQQNVFLFDDTIRENLKYGKVDATDDQLWLALDAANLGNFVRSLPLGLDTQVGERGTLLSGGQKQRISIARVFLKNPQILIFDEATSSLDTESEELINEAFHRLSKGRTAIVIAHRLTTIKHADCILVLDEGKLVESGTHEQLLALGGQYAKLYKTQDFS